MPAIPVRRAVTSIPSAHTVSAIPRVPASVNDKIRGSESIWITPMNIDMRDEMIIRSRTPFLEYTPFHPSARTVKKLSLFEVAEEAMFFFTNAAAASVRKKVQISITRRSFISYFPSSSPAMIGESRYLALPEREIIPLALVNSSSDKISVTVAR